MFEGYIAPYLSENQAPCLKEQIKEFSKTRPFEKMDVLDATPIYFNTFLKYEALLAGGANLEVFCNGKNFDFRAVAVLQQHGIRVHVNTDYTDKYDVIFDCGAMLESVTAVFGRVELTASGIEHYKKSTKFVVNVDGSRLKEYETLHGTSDGLIRALKKLDLIPKNQKKRHNAIVFGYGKVGKGICRALLENGFMVYVVELPGKIVKDFPYIYAHQIDVIRQAVSNSELVISAAGVQNAAGSVLGAYREDFPKSVKFINMGFEQDFVGWGNAENDGYPLNFILEEPTRVCFIDPVMALSNACGARLIKEGDRVFKKFDEFKNILLPSESDEKQIERLVKKISKNF